MNWITALFKKKTEPGTRDPMREFFEAKPTTRVEQDFIRTAKLRFEATDHSKTPQQRKELLDRAWASQLTSYQQSQVGNYKGIMGSQGVTGQPGATGADGQIGIQGSPGYQCDPVPFRFPKDRIEH